MILFLVGWWLGCFFSNCILRILVFYVLFCLVSCPFCVHNVTKYTIKKITIYKYGKTINKEREKEGAREKKGTFRKW